MDGKPNKWMLDEWMVIKREQEKLLLSATATTTTPTSIASAGFLRLPFDKWAASASSVSTVALSLLLLLPLLLPCQEPRKGSKQRMTTISSLRRRWRRHQSHLPATNLPWMRARTTGDATLNGDILLLLLLLVVVLLSLYSNWINWWWW